MYTQHNMLACRIDLCFLDYRLVIEIDENGHSNRNIDYELKRQKEIEQDLILCSSELILTKKTLLLLTLEMKYLDTSNNRLIN